MGTTPPKICVHHPALTQLFFHQRYPFCSLLKPQLCSFCCMEPEHSPKSIHTRQARALPAAVCNSPSGGRKAASLTPVLCTGLDKQRKNLFGQVVLGNSAPSKNQPGAAGIMIP